ncbi:hypothetical protein BGC07_05230 [Piscirickettsia litoralis]|uniref:Uncharacterized protein n=2 Tax=Piscirickettsia litoralis TaxID=1891921 RepID=A0ABX3A463_9GAMM|nr:hypothetical protein BGC07_05230 [Piscirickettsia litoralis]
MNHGEVKARGEGSSDVLASGHNASFHEDQCQFGGCMAIYVKSDDLYGLFHLELTQRNGASFKSWIQKIKQLSQGAPLLFYIGKPHSCDTYPETSVRGCLLRHCREAGLEVADDAVIMLDMKGVTYVRVDSDEMLLTGANPQPILLIKPSKYQTDEEYIIGRGFSVEHYNRLAKDDPDIGPLREAPQLFKKFSETAPQEGASKVDCAVL